MRDGRILVEHVSHVLTVAWEELRTTTIACRLIVGQEENSVRSQVESIVVCVRPTAHVDICSDITCKVCSRPVQHSQEFVDDDILSSGACYRNCIRDRCNSVRSNGFVESQNRRQRLCVIQCPWKHGIHSFPIDATIGALGAKHFHSAELFIRIWRQVMQHTFRSGLLV
jgi:hypothetical protein